MDRSDFINMSRVAAGQEAEYIEGERLSDKTETRLSCLGDVCGLAWKPLPNRPDTSEDSQKN